MRTTITTGPVSLTLTPARAGGFTGIQVGSAVTSYGRDFLDHLVSSSASTGATSFTYRYTGDRIKEAWTVEATPKRTYAFGYDDQTNLSAISTYDSAGTTVTSTTCLLHDGLNRLVAVGPALVLAGPDATACRLESDLSTVRVRFQYDAQHRRIARQDGTGPWKQYVMAADGSPLSELTRPTTAGGSWSPVRDYVWLDGKPLVQLEYPGPQVYAVHSDHLGLPRAMTSSSGSTVWSAATRPYGDLVETSSTGVVTNLRLPGQYDERLLGSVGLQGPYYNWNRWYLPMAGRYLELDPIALGGALNGVFGPDWYGYSSGNPISNADSTGLMSSNSATELMKALALREAANWMVEMWSDWTFGGSAGLLCAARACKSHAVPRDYFEAFGDCVAIIGGLNMPLGIEPSDQFVASCASSCAKATNSNDFRTKCKGSPRCP